MAAAPESESAGGCTAVEEEERSPVAGCGLVEVAIRASSADADSAALRTSFSLTA